MIHIELDDAEFDWISQEEKEGDEEKEDLARKLAEKTRRYVDDPSDAPDDASLQEGERGGVYYETESEADAGSSDTPEVVFGGVDFTQFNEHGSIPADEQERLRNHLAEKHGEEVAEDFYGDWGYLNEWKAHRGSEGGVKLGTAFARALDMDEEKLKNYDDVDTSDVTDKHVEFAKDLHKAGKTWFRERHGDSAEMNRGFKNGGGRMLASLFADEEDAVELSGNIMDNWSSDMDIAKEWGRRRTDYDRLGAIVRQEKSIEDFIMAIDGIAGEYPTHHDNAVTFDGTTEVKKENISIETNDHSFYPHRSLEGQDLEAVAGFMSKLDEKLWMIDTHFDGEEGQERFKEMIFDIERHIQQKVDSEDKERQWMVDTAESVVEDAERWL